MWNTCGVVRGNRQMLLRDRLVRQPKHHHCAHSFASLSLVLQDSAPDHNLSGNRIGNQRVCLQNKIEFEDK